MNNQELDILKKFFSCSSEFVIIANYDFEILWQNRDDISQIINNNNLPLIFECEKKPLDSKEYFFSVNGAEYSCRIINHPESKLYILQTNGENTIVNYMRSAAVRHFFKNQAASIRFYVGGISAVADSIRNAPDEKKPELINDFFNNTLFKNCRLIVRSAVNQEELIKYVKDLSEPTSIDLTQFLKNFYNRCTAHLKNQIRINLTTEQELYIYSDQNKFNICMLSLLLLAGKSCPDSGEIFIDAKAVNKHIMINVTPGTEKRTPVSGRLERRYNEDEANPELLFIYLFCRHYNGTLFVADNEDNNGKTYSMRFPTPKCTTKLTTGSFSYRSDNFSNYGVFLSEIADIDL